MSRKPSLACIGLSLCVYLSLHNNCPCNTESRSGRGQSNVNASTLTLWRPGPRSVWVDRASSYLLGVIIFQKLDTFVHSNFPSDTNNSLIAHLKWCLLRMNMFYSVDVNWYIFLILSFIYLTQVFLSSYINWSRSFFHACLLPPHA